MVTEYDALIIGSGIAGLQSASDLADQGKKVLIVEKGPGIGGMMILLSKVFPTLDCSSCITTPKMSYANNHANIEIQTMSEVTRCERSAEGFVLTVRKEARYVDVELCTGCGKCEAACPVLRKDPFEFDLGVTKAIHIPFKNAIPLVSVLDLEHCIMCGACERVCPVPGCINYLDEPSESIIKAGAIILGTGFQLTPMEAKAEYNATELPNVISPLQMERLLAPHGPYGGVLRPSDGRIADSIAFVQCAGSRDESLGVPYCSRVCCMYAIKEAMLLSGALPLADISIYYMDIRAFGKGYEQFYQNAKAMGINFIKGKVAKITEAEEGNVKVRIELIGEFGGVREYEHDLCVLSLGMLPTWPNDGVIPGLTGEDGFIQCADPKLASTSTLEEGIFVAGTAVGPKDIVDSVVEGSAAAMAAAAYLEGRTPKEVT